MCDYSLEAYKSRPAMKGERYTLYRFPSGSKGFVAAEDCTTAVCMTPQTRLKVSGIPEDLRDRYGLAEAEEVTFIRLDEGWYRDGVQFADGRELSLQQFPVGLTAEIAQALEDRAPAEPERREPELVS